MLNRLRTNPFWVLFIEKQQNISFAILAFVLNTIATLLEGVSFAFLMFSFMCLNGEMPKFLERFDSYSRIHFFTFFMLGAFISQILRSTFTYFGQTGTAKLVINLQNSAQQSIYHQIFRLTYASVNRYKIGDLMHHVMAPPSYFRAVMESINRCSVSSMMIIGYLVFMIRISLSLTVCVLTVFALGAFLQKTLIRKIVKASQNHSECLVKLNEETAQNLSGLRTVHLFDKQEDLLKKIHETLLRISKEALQLNKWNQLILPINETISAILVAAALTLGIVFLRGYEAQIFPLLMTFLALTYHLGTRLQAFMVGVAEISYYRGPVKRYQEFLFDEKKEFLDRSEKPSCLFKREVEFKSVFFKYPGKEKNAVDNISFTIPKGKVIALVGPSGGGKSSLLDLLLRLYEPSGGVIHIDGKPLNDYSLSSWRSHFGVVSQDVFLFHDTIEENIRFGNLSASKSELKEAAHLAGADLFIDHLPEGYQTVVGEKGYKLSGGERQRISLARALVRRPEILVLDEATSNLDSYSEKIIQDALKNLRGTMTMLVIAHRLATINMADQIFLIEKGKIIERGTRADFINLAGHYQNLWNLQTSTKPRPQLSTI